MAQKLEILNTAELQTTFNKETTQTPESRFLHRMHCIVLVAQGCSCYQIAKWFGENPRTIERWVHHFIDHGVEGIKDEQKTGRPSSVRDDQLRKLKKDLAKSPREFGYKGDRWNGEALKIHLKQFYTIQLSVRQCQRLLTKMLDFRSPEPTVE